MNTPETLTVHPEFKSLHFDQNLQRVLPALRYYSEAIDARYESDRFAAFERIHRGRFSLETRTGRGVIEGDAIFDVETAVNTEAMLWFAPFSDPAPNSGPEDLLEYVNKLPHETQGDAQRGMPHSWNQSIKSYILHELLREAGYGMPVITIYGLTPQSAFTPYELNQYAVGDFSVSAVTAVKALRRVQDMLHGPREETQINLVNFGGASLGAHHALFAAAHLRAASNGRFQTESYSGQELILGPKSLSELTKFARNTGEPAGKPMPDVESIAESKIRTDTDGGKNELQFWLRIVQGMLKTKYLKGLTRPEPAIEMLRVLQKQGVSSQIALAENSAITQQTMETLPEDLRHSGNMHFVNVQSGMYPEDTEAKPIDHLINEFGFPSAVIALRGVMKSNGSPNRLGLAA